MTEECENSVRARVIELHCGGMPPSEIDERLGLEPGHAKYEVVGMWRNMGPVRGRAKKAVETESDD